MKYESLSMLPPKRARKGNSARIPTEEAEQRALLQWWGMACKGLGVPEGALMHIPNEGFRHVAYAKKLHALGLRRGVPDLLLAYPTETAPGLWLEMKRLKGGRVSPEQEAYIALLRELGYIAHVCRGWAAAKDAILQYLKRGATDDGKVDL